MTIDTTNDGGASTEGEDVDDDTSEDTTTTTETNGTQRKPETPEAKRARLTRQLEQLDKKYPSETSKPAETRQKSGELDYGMKALLRAEGIKGEAETKLVQEFMRETGKDLEKVLESKHFKAELEEVRELARTAEATPSGKRSGTSTVDSVEYWMSKPFEEVPQNMRAAVVNAKVKQETQKGVFYNSPN